MEDGEGERGEKRPREEDEKSGEESPEGPDRKKVKIGCGLKRGAGGSPLPPAGRTPGGRGRGRGLPGKFRPPRRVAKKEDMSTDGASDSPPPPAASPPTPAPSLLPNPTPAPTAQVPQNAPPSPPPSIVTLPVAPVPPPNSVRPPLVVVKPQGGQIPTKPLVVVGAGACAAPGRPIVLTAPQRPALVPPAPTQSPPPAQAQKGPQPVPLLDDESQMDEQMLDPMDIPETVTFTSGSGRSLPAPSARALAEVSRRLGADEDADKWSVYVEHLKSNSSFQQPDGGEGERAGQGAEPGPVEFKVPVKRK